MPAKRSGSRSSSTKSVQRKKEKRFYAKDRKQWRAWLRENHRTAPEIWLVYDKAGSGKPRVSYNDAVEEALCYGWIDSIIHGIDDAKFCQRFSPRKPTSKLSPMNLERVRKLVANKKMTKAGLKALEHAYEPATDKVKDVQLPADIRKALRANKDAWNHFQTFPAEYQRIRIGWIDMARSRPEEFDKRLRYFIKRTAEGKRFGYVKEMR